MLKQKEMTAAEACKRMDALAREYLHLDRFDPRRAQVRKELHELAALVEPSKDARRLCNAWRKAVTASIELSLQQYDSLRRRVR